MVKKKSKKRKKRRLSDYCKECKALSMLKRIVRDGSLLSFGEAKQLLDEKLGPDPNRDQAPGHEKHPGLRNFVQVSWPRWQKAQWMEETGHTRFWTNNMGGRCPKGDDMKVINSIWVEDWDEVPEEDA